MYLWKRAKQQVPSNDFRRVRNGRCIKTTLGKVPIPGLAEVFSRIFAAPLEKRRLEWMKEVAGGLRKLEVEHGVRLEQLQDNPAFIDAVFRASQAAVLTSQEEKKAALRNAVLNSAG